MIGHSLGIVLLRGVRQYGFLRRAATTPLSNEIPRYWDVIGPICV